MKKIQLLTAALLLPILLQGQGLVTTQGGAISSGDLSSTIAVTNTFQSIALAANTGGRRARLSCLIINNSTNRQWVFFGPIASATKAKSIPLEAAPAANALGGNVTCTIGGSVLQDQISITGTMGDTFVAKQQ